MSRKPSNYFQKLAHEPSYFAKKAFPIFNWLPKYRPSNIPYDIVAGLTVGLTLLPVSLAYAQMAYLRPEYGLYSCFFGQLIYMLIGTSKDAVIGPSAIGSMLVGRFNLLNPLNDQGDNTYSSILTMVSGIVILLVGLFRLGFVANFFSIPVISGFSTAACFAITASQFTSLFGIKTPFEGSSFVFIRQIKQVFDNSDEIRLADTVFGLSMIAFLLSADCFCSLAIRLLFKFSTKNPTTHLPTSKFVLAIAEALRIFAASRNSVGFILAVAISYFIKTRIADQNFHLTLVGHIKSGMPSWHFPRFTLLNDTVPSHNNGTIVLETTMEIFSKLSTALIVMPIMSMAELFAIVRAMGRKNGYEVRPTNELVAVGLANIFQSFLGAQPITVATAKTTLNNQCRVRSQLSAIISASIVIVSTATLTEIFHYVPKAALAAILINAALHLFDYQTVIDIWRLYKPDLFFFFFTFTVCLFYNLAFGVLLAIGLSLMTILWSNVRETQLAIVTPAMERQLVRLMSTKSDIRPAAPERRRTLDDDHIDGPTVTIFMKRDVRFPGADGFTRRMLRCLDDPNGDGSVTVRRLVIDGRFCRHFDYTSLQAWRQVVVKAAQDHKSLFFMNFSNEIRTRLELLLRPIGADFIFDDDDRHWPRRKKLPAAAKQHQPLQSVIDVSTVKMLNESSHDNDRHAAHFPL